MCTLPFLAVDDRYEACFAVEAAVAIAYRDCALYGDSRAVMRDEL
jgi:hypothetical protein